MVFATTISEKPLSNHHIRVGIKADRRRRSGESARMDEKDFKSPNRTDREPIIIRGLVIPVEWDDAGNVVAVSIADFNEEKYYVTNNPSGKALLDFIEHEVTAVGTLDLAGSKKYFNISDFFSFGTKSGQTPGE